jgi:hypothetical protein
MTKKGAQSDKQGKSGSHERGSQHDMKGCWGDKRGAVAREPGEGQEDEGQVRGVVEWMGSAPLGLSVVGYL